MASPKPRPAMQNRIPIISSRWPSNPRNETEERSGSFRPASPPTSGDGWARAAEPEAMTMVRRPAAAAAFVWAKRHPRNTRSASQVRIENPPLNGNNIRMTTGSGYFDPAHGLRSLLKRRARERMAGVPNTLPLQDLNRDAEFGRVGCSLCRRQRNTTPESTAQDQFL